MVQLDVCQAALDMIAKRSNYPASRHQLVQDDATTLSSISSNSVKCSLDKGLVDALFCADEHDQLNRIVQSTLRVLQPGGTFCIFSRSRPEFLLPRLVPVSTAHSTYSRPGQATWEGLQMQEVTSQSMLVYRFVKSSFREPTMKKFKKKK